MIHSFRCKHTAAVFNGLESTKWGASIQARGLRKLRLLDAAKTLNDLRSPPGNELEKLTGNRAGQWSIRINKQWRVCFKFKDNTAYDVEITDYH